MSILVWMSCVKIETGTTFVGLEFLEAKGFPLNKGKTRVAWRLLNPLHRC